MKSILSVITGSAFIIITFLVLQLVALLTMVSYKMLSKDYPFLNEIDPSIFRYLIAIPAFLLVMFVGGYITAMIAKNKVLLHTLIVGVITAAGSMGLALDYMKITLTGAIVMALMLAATVAGGMFWQRRNKV
ncbi:MAG: hypothetical protein KAG34_07100 [Cocleimonas sp.]|nr:hypothetical protein [Cocleimonas sp.]